MPELQNTILQISTKLNQLLMQLQHLKIENAQQRKLIKDLQATNQQNNNQIHSLQQQVQILKSTASPMNPTEKKAWEKNNNTTA